MTEAGSGVVRIFATESAFAALKDDGSVVTWGNQSSGGSAPSSVRGENSGVVQVFTTSSAFAALKQDGSVVAWGDYGAYAPPAVTAPNSGVVQIFAGSRAFAALKKDGSVVTWGDSSLGGYTGNISGLNEGVVQVYANFQSFAALKADGSVVVWGVGAYGGDNAPTSVTAPGSGVVHIVNSSSGFAALKADGSVVSWGYSYHNMNSQGVAGLDSGVISVAANSAAFAAVKIDGSVVAWGHLDRGGVAPLAVTEPNSGVIQIFNTGQAFAALKADGSVVVWGDPAQGGANAPDSVTAPGSGVVQIFTTSQAFAALKSDGTVVVWGNPERGGSAEGLDLSGIIAVSNPFDSAISLDPNPALAYSIEDATGQATGPLTDGDTTDETTPIFSGTVSSEATVSLYVNGSLLDSVRANENGQWNYTPETALADGEYAFHVLVFAANGTYLGFSPTVTITVDGPPGVPTLALAADTGADTTDGLTANPTIHVGNLKTDATWEYRIDGGDWLAGSGVSFDLDEGTYAVGQIEVRQTVGGQTTPAGTNTTPILVDLTEPALLSGVSLPGGGATNDNLVTLDLSSLESEAVWEYSLNGGQTWNPGLGSSFLLNDGEYAAGDIQVRQVDAAGNPGEPVSTTEDVTIDTVPPDTPVIASDLLTNTAEPIIAGTAEPDSTVVASVGGAVYTVTTDAQGRWSVNLALLAPDSGTGPLSLQANGDNAISVTATDAAGNTSTAGSQTLVIDTTPPPVPTGVTLPAGGPTNQSTVTVDLAALEDGATWQYSLDGGHTWEDGEGDSFALEDGDYGDGDIQVRQVDAAGNPSQPVGTTADVTIDTVLPDPPEITSNPLTITAKPVIAGTAEPGSTVVVNVDSATFTLTVGDAGNWSLDLALASPDAGSDPLDLVNDGEHVVSVTATDAAGNTSTAGSQTLVIDTTPPLAPDGVTLPTGGPTNNATVTLNLHALENGATWQYSLDGGQSWQDGEGSSFHLEDGHYVAGAIQVRQVDAAGNLGEPVSTTANVTVDTLPPIPPTIDTPDLTNETLPVISGTAEADSLLIVTLGIATYTVQANANGDWTLDLATQAPDSGTGPLDLDVNGVNPISVMASDAAGNSSEVAGQTLTIDTTPPATPGGVVMPEGGPTRIDIVTVDLSALEDGARWQYSLDGGQNWYEGEGDSFHLDDGDYAAGQIQVRQVDAAGNPGQPASTTNAVIIDTVAPTAPTIDSPDLANQITPTLSGTAEAGSTLTVSLGSAVYTLQADENGGWTLDLANQPPDHGTGPLDLQPNGDNTVSVTATDAAGNTSTAGGQTLVIDTTPPATPRATLPGGGASSSNVVTISGLEADALWQYSLDGGNTWRDGSGQQFLIPDGDYRPGQIQVRQLDPAGNSSEPVRTSANVSIDTAAPLTPVLAVTERDGHTWIDVGRLEASTSWHYSLDGGATWLTGSGTAFALPPGQYPAGSIQVRQIDGAGNASPVGRHEHAVDSRAPPPDTPVDPADTDGDGMPDALEAQYGLIVGVKDNDVFARDDLFVLQLYRDGLAREADAGGLAHWLDGLEQTDRGSVVEAFLKTVEVWSHPLVQFYQVVLDRLPDSPGLRAWMHEAESGASLAAIADAFLVSPEFSGRFGTPDDQAFIDLLYGQVLEREADSGGSTYWLEVLASGTSRGEVLLGFVASPEHLAQSGQPAAVVVAYSSLLGRMPTADEYDNSLLYLAGSGSVYGLVNELMATQEYAARFLPEAGSVSGLPASAGVDVDSWLA